MTTTAVKANAAESTTQEAVSKRTSRVPAEMRNGPSRSDDEILGLVDARNQTGGDGTDASTDDFENSRSAEADTGDAENSDSRSSEDDGRAAEADIVGEIFKANPKLRQDWQDVREYRELFATPQEARNATVLLNDVKRMDALFFSGRAEDHAALARSIAALSPTAFASLAKAMAAEEGKQTRADVVTTETGASGQIKEPERRDGRASETTKDEESRRGEALPDKNAFYQSTNAAAVQTVIDAIQTQVERLLPEGASKTTRNRVVGEIYRELDRTLGENRQLAQQVREAMQSGALDASQQRAIVSLVSGRARQALPSVAKKVMDEWTSTILAADRGRRARQRAAEQRVDIVGSGGAAQDGRRGTSPRDIDYSRLSDADILNL